MAINFQHYLQSICNYDKYSFWQYLYTSTEALDRQRVTSKTRRKCLELVLMVQTIQLQRKGEAPDKEKIERLEVLTGLKKYAANHVLLVGKPGSGKSTALKRLLWEEAQHRKLNYIPVLVELRQYQTTVLDLIQNFLQRHHLHLATAKIEKLLNEGRFLLLVDGVNELPNRKARLDLDKFRQNHPKTPMIFTIRDLGVAGDLGIEKKLEMQPLTAEQMQQFVCAHLPDKGEDMLRQLGGRLKEMGERPLLLLMLCQVFEDNDSLPSNLGEIFRKYTKYYDSKIKEDVPVTAESRERWSLLLQHLAFTMMQGNSQTQLRLSISKNEADDILTEFLKAKNFDKPRECSFSWLKDLLNHHLIQLTNDGQIEFCHQLLQEYYTAECLLMQLNTISDAKLKRDYLNYLKWTEPLALMLALVDDTAQAVRVVKLALEVDLMLGARLAGEVKREFQEQTVRLILNLDVKRCIKSYLLVLAGSECGIDFLIESLGNKDDVVRSSALEVLEKIGNYQAVSVLIATLQHENSYLRWSAAQALGNIGNYQAVPALIAALQDEYYDVRWSAAQALGNIGNYQAVPALIAALQDEDDDVSWSAADALGNISNDKAVTALIAALQHEDDDVRWRATDALGNIGNDQAVPALIAALQQEDSHMRSSAADALENISNHQAVTALIASVRDEDSHVRSSAADALGKIGNDQAVLALIAALQHEDSHVRSSAADALENIGKSEIIDQIWEVYKQAPSTDNRDIILKIQRSCNFYNYKLFRSPPIVEDNQSDPLLNTLNKLNQTMSGISETPKYDLRGAIVGNFADKVESGAKLQAIQHIHIPEQRQNIASAAKEIQELLAQLAQTNPSIVESQDSNTIEAAIKAEIQRNTTVKSRLRNALKQGTTEALKQALDAFFKNPFVSISVETIKGFIEAE